MLQIRNHARRLFLAACLLSAVPALRAAADPPPRLAPRLDALMSKAARAQVGLLVSHAESADVWYARNADAPLKPASVMKLLTTAAALQRFGPDFVFQTELFLAGDELLVLGGGDPGLGDERLDDKYGRTLDGLMASWVEALTRRGVSRISRLVLDDHVFDHEFRHPDWPVDQGDRWYQAPVGGLNLNGNCLDAAVRVSGEQIELKMRPELPESFLHTSLRVGRKQQVRLSRGRDADVFQLTGTVSRNVDFAPIAMGDPTATFGHALKRALERGGVSVAGPVVRRRLTAEALRSAVRVGVHRTRLDDALWRANTFSQNLFAECLLKALAAYEPDGTRGAQPGGWPAGVRALEAELGRLGVSLSGATLSDGSGLSHSNRVSAAQVVAVLCMARRAPHGSLYAESLAQPGRAGTMRTQYSDPRLSGRLRGKTGTISGVRTLAGYIDTERGPVAFALLINGEGPDALPLDVCRTIVECARN